MDMKYKIDETGEILTLYPDTEEGASRTEKWLSFYEHGEGAVTVMIPWEFAPDGLLDEDEQLH